MNERTTDVAQTGIPLPERPDRPYTPPLGEQGEPMTGGEAAQFAGRGGRPREPLARAERILIAMFAGLVVMFAATLGAGAVAFTTISGQLLDLQEQIGDVRADIGSVRGEIGGLRAEMHTEIGELRAEMHKEIGELRTELRTEMQKGFGQLSERIGNLEVRMTRVETLLQTQVPPAGAPSPAGP